MTLDDILSSLFGDGCAIARPDGLIRGSGKLADGRTVHVVGVSDRTPLGVDGALLLSGEVLDAVAAGGHGPILVLVDSDSQRMSKRDELLGLNEFLAHLAKALIFADLRGRPTVGVLYGHTAAGAFIATALATRVLVGLPGAEPEVMDLPSMSKVTKLSVDGLKEKAQSTPVFAPRLDHLAQTGAVLEVWDDRRPLSGQLSATLARLVAADPRDRLGPALAAGRGARRPTAGRDRGEPRA